MAVAAAVLMAAPVAANPITLADLLRLPLEELLRLEISAAASAPPPRLGASLALPLPCAKSTA